jgi:tetratricopeptide (TPR) repeat protein
MSDEIQRARALLSVGRAEQAQGELARLLARAPDSVEGLCLLARCHEATDRYREMLAASERAAAAAPDAEWPHRLRSIALRKLDRVPASVAAARRSVQLAPHIWQAHVNLVEALLADGSVEALRDAYRSVLQARRLAPEEPEVHVAGGRFYHAISDPAAARRCYQRTLALDPGNGTARNNLAVVELRQGRPTRAGERLQDVLAERPTEALYQRNARATAVSWTHRLLEFGTLAWLTELILAQLLGPAWGLRLAAAVVIVGSYLTVAGLRYRRLAPPLRRMVRQTRFALPLAAVQVVTVPAIALAWHRGPAIVEDLLTPLLIGSFAVGVGTVIQLRNRIVQRIVRVWRRWRYRWTVVRPVERVGQT